LTLRGSLPFSIATPDALDDDATSREDRERVGEWKVIISGRTLVPRELAVIMTAHAAS